MPSLTEAGKFRELLNLPSNTSPYLFDKIFDDSGFWARRLSKKKFKLLKNIDTAIRSMLKPGEAVCFLTWGVEENTSDALLLGRFIQLVNYRAFVLTTSRILMVQITPGYKTAPLRGQIEYAGISEINSSLMGNLSITFHNGEKTIFTHVPKGDRKFLGRLIDGLRRQISETGRKNLSAKSDLCPHCYKIVDAMPESCPHCRGRFKTVRQAVYLSFILPGLGYWYLGYKLMGFLPMVIAAVIWIALIITLTNSSQSDEIIGILIPMTVIYVFTALTTWKIAKKGIYPGETVREQE